MTYDAATLKSAIAHSNGDAEVTAQWLAANRGCCRLIDVREPHELEGPLGAIEDAENIPLQTLLSSAGALDRATPVALVCRSGRRSAEAAQSLSDAGVETVASVEGGMIAWNVDVLGKGTILTEEKAANTANLDEAITRINGLPEVAAQWVAANIGRFRLIDVREPHEIESHGKVAQSENIPMATFLEQAQSLDRDAPLLSLIHI